MYLDNLFIAIKKTALENGHAPYYVTNEKIDIQKHVLKGVLLICPLYFVDI